MYLFTYLHNREIRAVVCDTYDIEVLCIHAANSIIRLCPEGRQNSKVQNLELQARIACWES